MKRITRPALVLLSLVALFSGTAQGAERIMAFAVPGVIAEVKVKPGMRIEKGTVLAVLDQRPLLARNEAGKARVEAATIEYELLARRLEQTEQLFDSLSASAEDVENAQTAAVNARSELEDAKAHASAIAWRLERSTLIAPFGGTITRVPGYVGMVIPRLGDVVTVVVIKNP